MPTATIVPPPPPPSPHRSFRPSLLQYQEPQAHLQGVSSRRNFAAKVLLVYHPDRCRSQMCLDLHCGLHGRVVVDGGGSGVWGLDHARCACTYSEDLIMFFSSSLT